MAGANPSPRGHHGSPSPQWRGFATRYEKTAAIYPAGLHIAGVFLWSVR